MAGFGSSAQATFVIHQPPTANTSRTILVVDDHAGFRRTVRDFLPDYYTVVVECADGAEAERAYAACRPEWTLMDIDMPGMDGLTATRAIRAADPQARIIIVSSHNTPDFRAEAERAGVAAFVPKDDLFELRELLSQSKNHYGS